MMIARQTLLGISFACVAGFVGVSVALGQAPSAYDAPPPSPRRSEIAASESPLRESEAAEASNQKASHRELIEMRPKIGAMPVASERTSRSGARPLPIEGKWQDVVTTFEPDCGPRDMRDFSPGAGVTGELYDDYKGVNDRWWVELDYLRWRARGYSVPALVTQSPVGTNPAVAGRLPDAEILFGDDALAGDWRNGGRARLGWWAVDGQFVGYQAEYFGLEGQSNDFNATSTSAGPLLARPFFNSSIGAEDASLLSGPGLTIDLGTGPFTYDVDGSINISTSSDIHSFALTRRHVLWTDFERNIRTDWLLGYRYFRLDEGIAITDVATLNNPSGGPIAPGTLVRRIDEFDTTNDFHGGEVGLSGQILRGRWSLDMLGKLAVGNTEQSVDVRGNTAINPGGVLGFVPSPDLGGFLAQPDLNIGRQVRNAFTLMPEAEMAVAFQVNDYVSLHLGANVVYANRVARPGNQIDRNVNPTYFPPANAPTGQATPQSKFEQTYLLLYGFNAGMEVRW
ncbi:MAG: BBP7 family outer membrane beta-barrel protein [Pirellulales bacterium]